jgi:SAM-dependent methyltransferase
MGVQAPGRGRQQPDGSAAAYWTQVEAELEQRASHLDGFLGAMKRRAYVDLMRRWGGLPARGRILKTDLFEEAMGTADSFFEDLAASSSAVFGMDVSPAMTVRARRLVRPAAKLLACDTRRLPFADHSFALIVSPSTLDHFTNPADLGPSLRELRRVLAPEGRLIVTLDNRQNVFDPLLRLAIRLSQVPFYIGRSYRIGELCAELESAGFAVAQTTAIVHHPRMTAVAAVTVANRLGWGPLTRLTQRVLTRAQRLETSRWRYYTGCFVAALATPAGPGQRRC